MNFTRAIGLVGLTMMTFACASPPESVDSERVERSKQIFPVFTTPGARCIITRDGKTVADFVAQENGQESSVKLVALETLLSHSDIFVTCSKKGFISQSKTASILPMEVYETWAPCVPPADQPPVEGRAFCDRYDSRFHNPRKIWDYPRVYLKLKHDPAVP
jgi:hypothetical protein